MPEPSETVKSMTEFKGRLEEILGSNQSEKELFKAFDGFIQELEREYDVRFYGMTTHNLFVEESAGGKERDGLVNYALKLLRYKINVEEWRHKHKHGHGHEIQAFVQHTLQLKNDEFATKEIHKYFPTYDTVTWKRMDMFERVKKKTGTVTKKMTNKERDEIEFELGLRGVLDPTHSVPKHEFGGLIQEYDRFIDEIKIFPTTSKLIQGSKYDELFKPGRQAFTVASGLPDRIETILRLLGYNVAVNIAVEHRNRHNEHEPIGAFVRRVLKIECPDNEIEKYFYSQPPKNVYWGSLDDFKNIYSMDSYSSPYRCKADRHISTTDESKSGAITHLEKKLSDSYVFLKNSTDSEKEQKEYEKKDYDK